MNSNFYKAAQSGEWEEIKKFSPDSYDQTTTNGNTILHILAQFSCDRPKEAVQQILCRRSNMAFEKNRDGETALVIASRRGHSGLVGALIDSLKPTEKRLAKMLRAIDKHGNTALHEAVTNNRADVVRLLLDAAPEDFCDGENSAGESPLYVAVERRNSEIVKLICSLSTSPSFHGPHRRTALHAAAIRNSPECMEVVLMEMPTIIKEVDATGWTALHYAAMMNHETTAELLLSTNKSTGYAAATANDSFTPLHTAVTRGHLGVVKSIVFQCPDSWKMMTRNHQNILHLGVENEHKQVVEFILASSWASEVINMQDSGGNTPLHLYVFTESLAGLNLVNHPCVDRNLLNNDGLSPLGIIMQMETRDQATDRQNSLKDELVKAGATQGLSSVITRLDETLSCELKRLLTMQRNKSSESGKLENLESYMLVGTLIATVTFAAGFTVPGGYDTDRGHEGMAILSRKSAFATFVIADSLALMFSATSVFLQCLVIHEHGFLSKSTHYYYSKVGIVLAMAFLLTAFLAGVYAVIPVPAVRIYLIVFGCCIGVIIAGCLIGHLAKFGREQQQSDVHKTILNIRK